jgi:general nucleoside transport system ATP-binding protein
MEIALTGIRKHYGPIRANDGISLTVGAGTIHGILGENGAGKSTLMKILAGFIPRTAGTIRVDGLPVDRDTPARAAAVGIGMLYQEPLDFPLLSVLENFRLGQDAPDTADVHAMAWLESLSQTLKFDLDPFSTLRTLTVGERQQLEMVRLLSLGVRTLILDEPTTGISATQKALLFDALRTLAGEGKSVILVSHKLEDVEVLCDRVTVLRNGRVAGEMGRPFATDRLTAMMFGTPPAPPARPPSHRGEPVLAMSGVRARGGRTGLRDCTVTVSEGEVVGLAGLEGSGQGVFLRTAAGLVVPEAGTVRIGDRLMTGREHSAFRAAGVNFLPTDRLAEGLIPGLTLTEHVALQEGPEAGPLIRWAESRKAATGRIERFRISGAPETPVERLSGGNQQRFLLSCLSERPALLLLENPTRGLDLASARWVWDHLQAHGRRGTAVIFASAELDEIVNVAGRVLVFFDGAIILDADAGDLDVGELGMAIAGKAA